MTPMEPRASAALRTAVTWTRFVIYIPVVALFIGSLALALLGGWETVRAVYRAFFDGSISEKESLVDFIALADLFLLSTVLYIIALGLYELFVDDRLPLPEWLVVSDLDDLKEKLAGVIVVVLAVFYLGFVVKATDPMAVMWEGLGVSAMVLALSVFLSGLQRHKASGAAAPQALIHTIEDAIAGDVARAEELPTGEPGKA
jgi:uncharacterized membrane protein YqhA